MVVDGGERRSAAVLQWPTASSGEAKQERKREKNERGEAAGAILDVGVSEERERESQLVKKGQLWAPRVENPAI